MPPVLKKAQNETWLEAAKRTATSQLEAAYQSGIAQGCNEQAAAIYACIEVGISLPYEKDKVAQSTPAPTELDPTDMRLKLVAVGTDSVNDECDYGVKATERVRPSKCSDCADRYRCVWPGEQP